jgi:hypothetical protein|tara:strand:+ start:1704 stop:1895 length:192 start_codon:yes stop_codon:yes gene_type:complete
MKISPFKNLRNTNKELLHLSQIKNMPKKNHSSNQQRIKSFKSWLASNKTYQEKQNKSKSKNKR